DRSTGWERGTSVSRAWDQAATDAALETADYVAAHLAELSGVRDGADRNQRLCEFGRRFAELAFRRPLTDELKQFFVDRQFEGGRDPETAIKRLVLLVLKSPRFLYREIGTLTPNPSPPEGRGGKDSSPLPSGGEGLGVRGDAYDVASRLSFG